MQRLIIEIENGEAIVNIESMEDATEYIECLAAAVTKLERLTIFTEEEILDKIRDRVDYK